MNFNVIKILCSSKVFSVMLFTFRFLIHWNWFLCMVWNINIFLKFGFRNSLSFPHKFQYTFSSHIYFPMCMSLFTDFLFCTVLWSTFLSINQGQSFLIAILSYYPFFVSYCIFNYLVFYSQILDCARVYPALKLFNDYILHFCYF